MGEASLSLDEPSPSSVDDEVAAPGQSRPVDEVLTEVPPPLPGLEVLGDAPPAVISPTGVLLPVLSWDATGFLVQTPCGAQTPLSWGQPVESARVVLDPGHGGDEEGAIGPNGETEAELNLDISRRAARMLEAAGYPSVLTRMSDYRLPIRTRADLADRLQADVFISVHHNSPTLNTSPTPGTEVYVQLSSDASKRLGGLLYEEILSQLSVFDVAWSSAETPGVITVVNAEGENAYGINRYPSTPSVLAEFAYISNPSEATLLATDEYRQAAATAVAHAAVRYLETTDPGSGFVERPRLVEFAGGTGGFDDCVDPVLE